MKNSVKYLIIIVGLIIIIPLLTYSIFNISRVQTYILNRYADQISMDIEATISVEKVKLRFFNRIYLENLLIKGTDNDTIVFIGSINAGIRNLERRNKNIVLGKVSINEPLITTRIDSAGQFNFSFLKNVVNVRNGDSRNISMLIREIEIKNGKLLYYNDYPLNNKNRTNLNIKDINAIVEDVLISDSAKIMDLRSLSLKESSGLNITDLNSSIFIRNDSISLSSLNLYGKESDIHIPVLEISGDPETGFENFIEKVGLNIVIDESSIYSEDIISLFKEAGIIGESLSFSGNISGTMSELRGRNVKAQYEDWTSIEMDIDISGLPDLKNSYIFMRVDNLTTNALDIEKIRINDTNKLMIPEIAYKLGTTKIEGRYSGFFTDFVVYSTITTSMGNISTDISVKPDADNGLSIRGLIEGAEIDIGYLTGVPELLGKISLNADIDGIATRTDKYSGNLTGKIDSLDFNNYKYRNIVFNGAFDDQTWNGYVGIAEENIEFDLNGMLNFNRQLPEFDFSFDLTRANLFPLNIDKSDSISILSLKLSANFEGNNFDNVLGEINLHNSNFKRNGLTLDLSNFLINSYMIDSLRGLSLRTDFVDADFLGNYDSSEIISLFNNLLISLFPSKFGDKPASVKPAGNNLTFSVDFKESDNINNFFNTGFQIAEDSRLFGRFIQDSMFIINGEASTFEYRNFVFNKLSFLADINYSNLDVIMNSESLLFPWLSEIMDLEVDFKTEPDTFSLELDWDNQSKIRNYGSLLANGRFIPQIGKEPKVVINISQSNIYNNDYLWEIFNSSLILDTTSIKVEQFNIKNRERYFSINGTVSENHEDTLFLDFNELDLSPINRFAEENPNKPPNAPDLNIEGKVSGNLLLTDIYGSPIIESGIVVNDFSILDSNYGDLFFETKWNNQNKQLDILGNNDLNGRKMVDIIGYYDPDNNYIDIDYIANHLPVTALNSLLKSFASDISGTSSGRLGLSGGFGNLVLEGALLAENAEMRIDYLNTLYTINDSVYFDRNGIYFKKTNISDERGNNATIDGRINHKSFKDFNADLLINSNQAMVLNTRANDNEFVYGNVYATGVATLKADNSGMLLDISGSSERNTRVYIPLTNIGHDVSKNTFISFVDHNVLNNGETSQPLPEITTLTPDINMNLYLTVTPDAEIQLIFDSNTGDVINTTGSGDLNINLNSRGTFRITGDYLINDGNYLFTLGNLLNKSFSVEDGGRIRFNGDLNNTEIDLKAIYRVRASLYDILQDEKFSERIPVECQLTLSGNLINPLIEIGIYLPNADEETRSYLNSVISTEEELSRQFVYLLVMNSFYTGTGNSTYSSGSSALSVTTTEMLFNQVGNWLSQISNDFDIGFLYSPGFNNDINSQEFQVALSTQLLDDKVTINSDLGYRGSKATSSGNEQLTGDFDIEYKITEKIRLKAFNRFNNPYQGRQADYTQGVGIFYQRKFNKLGDLFINNRKSEAIREEETTEEP